MKLFKNSVSVRQIGGVFSRVQRTCPSREVLLGALLLAAIPRETLAYYSIGSLPDWDGQYEATGFSDSGDTNFLGSAITAGQTFRINEGNARVSSIAFPVINNSTLSGLAPGDFQVGIAALSGARITGPLLYLSGRLIGQPDVWQNFVVTPNDLFLNQGQQYLLFFTALGVFDGLDSQASMGYVPGDTYSDGQWCFIGIGGGSIGINSLLTQDWTMLPGDLAFQVNYDVVIPEPASITLILSGAAVLILRRKFPSMIGSLSDPAAGRIADGK
jgi:hypothetical protein